MQFFRTEKFASVFCGKNLGRASGGVCTFLELRTLQVFISGKNLGRASGRVCTFLELRNLQVFFVESNWEC